jgi:predicted Co/Zn/Cd cation transporter (cation efflux family)
VKRLDDLDRIRERLHRSVLSADAEVGLGVVFTRDSVWFRRSTPTGSGRESAD